MAEDDTLYYNDNPSNNRQVVEARGPWGTITFTPSPAMAEELAQLSHLSWSDLGSPESSLEGLGEQYSQHILRMVRHEGRDPQQGVDLGDLKKNPHLRSASDYSNLLQLVDEQIGDLSRVGGTTLWSQLLAFTDRMQPPRFGDDFGTFDADRQPGFPLYEESTAAAQRRYDDLSDPEFKLTPRGSVVDAQSFRPDSAEEFSPVPSDSDGRIEDIIKQSAGPDYW